MTSDHISSITSGNKHTNESCLKTVQMVQATIPSFKFDKQSEIITIEDNDEDTSNVVTVDLSEEDYEEDNFASDVQCLEVESPYKNLEKLESIHSINLEIKNDQVDQDCSYDSDIGCVWVKSVPIIMAKPDSHLLKTNDPVRKDESMTSDEDCIIIENFHENLWKPDNALRTNENINNHGAPLKNNGTVDKTQVTSDTPDIECVFVSSPDREQYKNNPRNKCAHGLAYLNVHTVGDKRTVVLNQGPSPMPTKKRKSSRDNEREERYNKKCRLNSDKNSHVYIIDEGRCFINIVDEQHSGLQSGVSNQAPTQEPFTKNSSVATDNNAKKNRLLTYKRLPYLSQTSPEKPPTTNGLSNIYNPLNNNGTVNKPQVTSYTLDIECVFDSSLEREQCTTMNNVYNPVAPVIKRTGLRPIVIDGSNVAFSHGLGTFSFKGIELCINFFEKRGHKDIKVFLPQFRKLENCYKLDLMEKQGTLVLTPSRIVNGKMVSSYDDRFIVQYAHEVGGVIISMDKYRDLIKETPEWQETIERRFIVQYAYEVGGVIISMDNYRDLIKETPEWQETIERRTLMFVWAGDILMFPKDPLGRHGPTLDEYLCYN